MPGFPQRMARVWSCILHGRGQDFPPEHKCANRSNPTNDWPRAKAFAAASFDSYAAPRTSLQSAVSRLVYKFLRRGLIAILVASLGLVIARTYVGDCYRVQSDSMEPSIHATPEQVFVRYERGFTPSRFDLVVFNQPAQESGAVVKRAVALPGESVLISGGDLLIEGHRLGIAVLRPEPIPIFDSKLETIESAFTAPGAPIEKLEDGWRLDARGRRADLTYMRPATDDHLDADGKRVAGTHEVNDLRLEGRFTFQGTGKFSMRLSEEGDAFELDLEIRQGIIERARILRRAGSAELAVLATVERPAGDLAGRSCTVAFENTDNHLIGEVGGQMLCSDYETNTPLAGVVNENDRHLQPRVSLAAAEVEVRIDRLSVARDLFYTSTGTLGTGSLVALGPDEIFVLGDNSADSRDSRVFGPVRLSDLAGRATYVVWPLKAARPLGGRRLLQPTQVLKQ